MEGVYVLYHNGYICEAMMYFDIHLQLCNGEDAEARRAAVALLCLFDDIMPMYVNCSMFFYMMWMMRQVSQ